MIGISSSYLTNPKTLNVFMIENRKNHKKKKKERKKENLDNITYPTMAI
jgi:hypothetical protein